MQMSIWTRKLLNVNISSLPQTISADFVPLFCIYLHLLKHNYRCFLILVQSFSACTFSRIVDSFHENKLLSVWSYIFLSNGPEKKPKQNNIHSNKKPKNFAEEPPSAKKNLFGALSQGLCADWLVCIAFCITGVWLAQTSCPIFLKLGSLPVCKGKSYLKLSKLILN